MEITLITGGARSGKSSLAQSMAEHSSAHPILIATATATDEEMTTRIERHRAARRSGWQTIEVPVNAGPALSGAHGEVVVLDCLTMLASNALASRRARSPSETEAAIDDELTGLLDAARSRSGRLFVVTNEVGSAIHPPTPIGRWFQDALGRANQRIAAESLNVVLMVSGLPLYLKKDAAVRAP